MTNKPPRPTLLVLCALLFTALPTPTRALASDTAERKLCLYQFRQKLYLRSANCFQALATKVAKRLANTQTPASTDKALAGSLLRNTSLAFRRAAKVATTPQQADYLRERALRPLQQLLKHKYYEDNDQKRITQQLLTKLNQQIGYTSLLIITNHQQSKIKLEGGFQFTPQTHTGNQWRIRLRAGTYTLLVTYPKQPLQAKQVIVKKGQSNALVTFSPQGPAARKRTSSPPPRKPSPTTQPPVLSWVMLGLGAAAIVGGVALIGVSSTSNDAAAKKGIELQNIRATQPTSLTVNDTEALKDLVDGANSQLAAGITIAATGITAGIVGFLLRPSPTRTNTTPSNKKETKAFTYTPQN